jgi:hypothetical protein
VPALSVRAAGPWTRIQSEHFLFISEASERQVRDLAAQLEQFREVVSRTLPPSALDSPVPTVVLVFRSTRSFTPYKPLFEGRPIAVNGFFQGGDDVNYMAVNVEFERSALRTLYHEFAHLLTQNMERELPVWANEGLASVYETFEVQRDGKAATFGLPNVDRLNLLQQTSMMPLQDLVAVRPSSPEYNDSSKRHLFYAQSWALMHYLMFGSDARAAELRDYLDLLKTGTDPDAAFREAFGDNIEGLEKELRDYVRRMSLPDQKVTFSEKVVRPDAGRGVRIDDAEAGAYLGDMLARMDRLDEARVLLEGLVRAHPASGRAASTLARVELAEGHSNSALPLLERALTLTPDDEGNRLRLADVLLRREQFERAVGYLEPLARDARLPDLRLRAQDLLEFAADRLENLRTGNAPVAGSIASELPTASATPAASGSVAVGGDSVQSSGSRFRPVRPGEIRVLGMLAAVECSGQSPVLVIDAADQSLHLATAGLSSVQFIGYDPSAPASPVCGRAATPARVFATYRDEDAGSTAVDGKAVAIEWLPEGFAPR